MEESSSITPEPTGLVSQTSADQELSSQTLQPGSTTDSVRESLSPTPSGSFAPGRNITIPTYGAVLAIIGTALLSLVCVTLILVPIYLYKKRSRRVKVYEDGHVEVSRHSDRSITSTMASYREPADALSNENSRAHNGNLRLTIRNRIVSRTLYNVLVHSLHIVHFMYIVL